MLHARREPLSNSEPHHRWEYLGTSFPRGQREAPGTMLFYTQKGTHAVITFCSDVDQRTVEGITNPAQGFPRLETLAVEASHAIISSLEIDQ